MTNMSDLGLARFLETSRLYLFEDTVDIAEDHSSEDLDENRDNYTQDFTLRVSV